MMALRLFIAPGPARNDQCIDVVLYPSVLRAEWQSKCKSLTSLASR